MIRARIRGQDYIFKTTPGLFSTEKIDNGTLFFINSIELNHTDSVLDLGCGYGVIGIVAAKSVKSVIMVDVDIRAVNYSRKNIKLNKIINAKAIPSDGFASLQKIMFDVVLSNPPSHVPREIIHDFVIGSFKHLNSGGKLYFVTESRLKSFIKTEFEKVFGNYEEIAKENKYSISETVKL